MTKVKQEKGFTVYRLDAQSIHMENFRDSLKIHKNCSAVLWHM